MLGLRRQRHLESDATEQRVNVLYTAAANQLGSDKAPVRLTALYTLERLADENPQHRQTIVNVICAYLRMPYTPPDQADKRPSAEAIRDHHRAYRAAKAGHLAAPPAALADAREEHQVRLSAQRILTDHLHKNPSSVGHRFWKNIDLDLTGAILTDLNLSDCIIRTARFTGATFRGSTLFDGVTFSRDALFDGVTFSGRVSWPTGQRPNSSFPSPSENPG